MTLLMHICITYQVGLMLLIFIIYIIILRPQQYNTLSVFGIINDVIYIKMFQTSMLLINDIDITIEVKAYILEHHCSKIWLWVSVIIKSVILIMKTAMMTKDLVTSLLQYEPENVKHYIKSLWPSDILWRQRSGSTLAQAMACCLTAPSHYLSQCWLIISDIHIRAIS